MRHTLRAAATAAALTVAVTLGFGGTAHAASAPSAVKAAVTSPTAGLAVAPAAARYRWIWAADTNLLFCHAYGLYYLRSGAALNYYCVPHSAWQAYLRLLVRY
ncbi:hypothetical protein PV371_27015 [Streptomyces sp. TX20-6-3]|uniref:hypothetical protein n=1 Tax=Streptomyces sp. TX20-6-3 TaxID=3028705 RepID=UPI0029A44BD5|nr:hypothetical protein [Streptomyces sp. TX20-6-3]MDX2563286.1 hypothetical protein [Streptomyces sp. TX20-6-3]